MKIYVQFWACRGEFFLDWEIFQIKDVDDIIMNILDWMTFSVNRSVYGVKIIQYSWIDHTWQYTVAQKRCD